MTRWCTFKILAYLEKIEANTDSNPVATSFIIPFKSKSKLSQQWSYIVSILEQNHRSYLANNENDWTL